MECLRKEIRTVIGYAEHPSREQIRKMTYLAMIIKESMHSESSTSLKLAHAL